jgi:uncharacterized membrane protein YdjX (TVP38/TMEM64 family)
VRFNQSEGRARGRLKARHLVWAILIILIAGAPFISYFLFPDDWIPAFYKWIKAQGLVGALVFAIVYVIICVLLLASAELMAVAAGFLYGPWGGALAVLSFFTAAVIAFLISRHFLRARVKAWTAKRPLLAAIDATVAEDSWLISILLRLNPFVPPNFQNYFFGATNIAPVPYGIATFFGIMPLTAVYVYLGAVGQSLVFEEGLTPSKIALLCLGLIASAAMVFVMSKKVGKKLREMRYKPTGLRQP